jgi:toxin ParE1/3/4
MNRFSVSPAARADIREIWTHVARDNRPAADRLRSKLQEVFLLLSRTPLLGQACDNLRSGLRFFCAGSYVVYYEATRRGVRIARVLHGARDAQTMFPTEMI